MVQNIYSHCIPRRRAHLSNTYPFCSNEIEARTKIGRMILRDFSPSQACASFQASLEENGIIVLFVICQSLGTKMPTSRSQRPPSSSGKKRRDGTNKDCLTNRTPSPPAPLKKPQKPSKSAVEAITAYRGQFFQHLSQSALNELDRRASRPSRIAIKGQPGLRGGETTELSTKSKRDCRQGGLDLWHLRGVRHTQS